MISQQSPNDGLSGSRQWMAFAYWHEPETWLISRMGSWLGSLRISRPVDERWLALAAA